MSSLSPKSAVAGYEHAIAGFGAGATATLLTYPLDLLRTRFQVKDLKHVNESLQYKSVLDAVRSIVRQEGLRGLYQGFMPNFIGSAIAWGQYFYLYQRFKELMRGRHTDRELGPWHHLAAGFSAGAVTATCTNPIWVVKTRMQTQMRGMEGNYRGLLHGIVVLWREEGLQGFYRGWIPALLGVSHGAVQFMAYEEIRKMLGRHLAHDAEGKVQMNTFHFMGMACLSKLAASVITYPALVLKSRLQIRPPQFSGFLECCSWTWRQQGVLGFYAGFWPNVWKVMPNAIITFVAYEHIAKMLSAGRTSAV
jgi:solute carrier family 25 folate transporter 32